MKYGRELFLEIEAAAALELLSLPTISHSEIIYETQGGGGESPRPPS